MLCPECHRILADIQDFLKVTSYEGKFLETTPIPHVAHYHALIHSSQSGCELCKLIVQALHDQVGKVQVQALNAARQTLSYLIDRYHVCGQLCIEAITFFVGYSDNPLQLKMFEASFRVELIQSGGLCSYFLT